MVSSQSLEARQVSSVSRAVHHLRGGGRALHPGEDLAHGHHVHVVIGPQHLLQPVEESLHHLRQLGKPGGVQVEAQGSSVLLVVPDKVTSRDQTTDY